MLLRKFSQTLKVSLALMLAVFSTGILPTATTYATQPVVLAAADDSDGDNVKNNKDKCENTPAGSTVDSDGCAESQLDTDKDSVMNDKDTCADTPRNETADLMGCAASQKDTDGDGVKDSQDSCPAVVGTQPDGCPVEEQPVVTPIIPVPPIDLCPGTDFPGNQNDTDECTDTDEDGVMNSKDDCPDTTPGATVDNKGCEAQANETPGNNGTLKIHEAGTPTGTEPEPGTENNDPKVCTFNVEGFGFDEDQDGYIVFDTQGGSEPVGTPAGPYTVGPADEDGYFETMYFNDENGPTIVNGTYKVTMYGKDTGGAIDYTDEKAKSKVFKVDCPPVVQEIPVTPVVTFLQPNCEIRTGRVVITPVEGVTYKINDETVTGTVHFAAGTAVTVTATLADNYVLAEGAESTWSRTLGTVPANCVLSTTDVCPNIEGTQTVAPVGFAKNPTTGDCFTPGRGAGTTTTGGQTLSASTELPETLPATGGEANPFLILVASLIAYGAAYFLQGRRLLGRNSALSA